MKSIFEKKTVNGKECYFFKNEKARDVFEENTYNELATGVITAALLSATQKMMKLNNDAWREIRSAGLPDNITNYSHLIRAFVAKPDDD